LTQNDQQNGLDLERSRKGTSTGSHGQKQRHEKCLILATLRWKNSYQNSIA
jgi:hypothetical protein